MKRRFKFTGIIAVFVALMTVFSACNKNPSETPEPSGQGGYDIEITSQTPSDTKTDSSSTTSKYSSEDKLIALTFDDGPHSSTTGRILDILEENNSVATFFVVGYNIERGSEIIRRATGMGCEIGNHSDGHKNLTKCTDDVLREQVDEPNKKIEKITGSSPTLFRVPGGAYKGVESDIGMPIIQWSIDTEDWKFKDAAHPDRTAEEREADLKSISDRVVAEAKNGDIILMHDIYNFTADLTDLIVKGLVEQGFKLVTVSEMFDAFGVELKDGTVYRKAENPKEITTLASGHYTVRSKYDTVNVRVEPSTESEIVTEIPNGTAVTVESAVEKWAFISFEAGSGWISSAFLAKQ
ncbi:MAG: polysaccharide deacetylase family protein [Clostridia bacterium]|nr:polysaccharide deacetylase family protein [Clostridia bacterium]